VSVVPTYIGIDGGGTKTDLAIVDAAGEVIARQQGPTSNQAVVGFAQASAALIEVITEAASEASIPVPLTAGWIGLAGSDRPEDRESFARALDYLVGDLRITNDAELVLSGTPDGAGIALIAGTGSIAFARNGDGLTGRSGGWGHIIGDEGSAYRVAVDGLRAVAAATDGRGPETELTETLMTAWRAETPQQFIPRVYDPAVKKADIAATAPLVIAAAERGDAVATAIIEGAGDDLAGLVSSLARRVPFPEPPPVACTGGLILRSVMLRQRVESQLDPDWVQPTLRPIEDIAVSAALAVRRLAQGEVA
jgi:N-acetylglucosamine kinase-like BadF-type ATPase